MPRLVKTDEATGTTVTINVDDESAGRLGPEWEPPKPKRGRPPKHTSDD